MRGIILLFLLALGIGFLAQKNFDIRVLTPLRAEYR